MNMETLKTKLNEMECLIHDEMEKIEMTTPTEAADFCELYYELDSLLNNINYIRELI